MIEDLGSVNYAQFLQQTYQSALERNSNAQKHWQKLKKDYATLESLLRDLPKGLTKDVMVPVAPKALMRGKIVHTNEILVCLGDGYFVKRSAHQAIDICKRREKVCSDMLQSLEKEQELLEDRKELPLRLEAFGGGADIVEEYDEQKEAQWREEHRRKEHEHHQRLAELREKERTAVTDEESLWKRLDELELQEELEEELDRLHAARGEDGVSDDEEEEEEEEEESTEEEEEVVEVVQHDLRKKNGIVQLGMTPTTAETPEPSTSPPLEADVRPQRRRVSFAGDMSAKAPVLAVVDGGGGGDASNEEEANELRITFSHSRALPRPRSPDPEGNAEGPPRSPGELFLRFAAAHAAQAAPRSILKKRSAYEGDDDDGGDGDAWRQSPEAAAAAAVAVYRGASVEREEEEEREVSLALATPLPPPVSDMVVERQPIMTNEVLETPPPRPVSRFKAMRQLQKKQ